MKTKHEQILADLPLNVKLEEFRKQYKDKILKGIIKTQLKNLLKDIYPNLNKNKKHRPSPKQIKEDSDDNNQKNKNININYVCKIHY